LFTLHKTKPLNAAPNKPIKEEFPRNIIMVLRLFITVLAALLSGCIIPGTDPDPRIAQREAEAKAIGSACRYGVRTIEDCYSINEGSSKAHIFAGWKEMDEYMRENKIEGIKATAAALEPVETVLEGKNSKALIPDKASEVKSKTPDKSPAKAASKGA